MSKINDLAAELRKLLASGLYPDGARFLSEYEIENRYGISRITANKAVAILVSEGLLIRGKRGSGTFVKRTKSFPKGWIAAIETLNSQYNSRIIAGAVSEAYAQGYMLSILSPQISNLDGSLEWGNIFSDISESDCVGVIGVTTLLNFLPENYTKPVVYMDGILTPDDSKKVNTVTCENFNAAYRMMQKIIAAGKKEIVFTGLGYHRNRRERLEGFMAALKDNNILDAEKRQYNMHNGSLHEVRLTLRKICADFPDVDFIATDSDEVAFHFIQVGKGENIDLPSAIGLSGFGNIHGIADGYNIPTVEQHPWHLGVAAVKGLLDVVNGRGDQEILQVEIPAEIINAEFI